MFLTSWLYCHCTVITASFVSTCLRLQRQKQVLPKRSIFFNIVTVEIIIVNVLGIVDVQQLSEMYKLQQIHCLEMI